MNILALDTSMGACSAAVLRRDGAAQCLFARQEAMARGHAEALLPLVADVLAEAGLAAGEIDLIAATTGPGSFTGVRIAIAAARGLALVTGAKLFGTDSLSVMAKTAFVAEDIGGAPFVVAVDARRGMLYVGLYDGEARRIDGPKLLAPDDAAKLLPATLHLAVGNGAALLAEAASQRGAQVEARLPELQPSAQALAGIADDSGGTSPALRPLYLRPPDAKPQAQAAAGRR